MSEAYREKVEPSGEAYWRKFSEYGLREEGSINGFNRSSQAILGFLEETEQNTFSLEDVADRLGRPKKGKIVDEKIPYDSFITKKELAVGMNLIKRDMGVDETANWRWGGNQSNYVVSKVRESLSKNSDYEFNWDNQEIV